MSDDEKKRKRNVVYKTERVELRGLVAEDGWRHKTVKNTYHLSYDCRMPETSSSGVSALAIFEWTYLTYPLFALPQGTPFWPKTHAWRLSH